MAIEPPHLAASGITAGYHGRAMIRDINLVVQPGDFTVLLGANGSGKSTLMRALSGQLALHAGTIRLGGIDLATSPETAKRRLGYAVDAPDLPTTLTGAQYLDLIASIRRCNARDFPGGDLIETLHFTPWLNQPIATYSLGTRMKLSILGALLGTPSLIMLDESLNGLDPLILARTRSLLATLCAAGHGVILATHMLGTIGAHCTELIMIEAGRVAHRWTASTIAAAGPAGLETMVVETLERVS